MLPNTAFVDFPVEFKEINPEDFNTVPEQFTVADKKILSVDQQGYITSLSDHIQLDTKETLVLNAPVGSGKSYQILQLIKKIIREEPTSRIILAVPFVSLVEQYVNELKVISEISKSEIYDYSDLGRHPKIPYDSKVAHVITVNTLLGNPGEDGFKNSEAKRKYLQDIINECTALNSKVYFIYDEIHDAISNFREEFIFNLWKWNNVIHKNIIISATFTEASKVVIKYLAELTDKKISILEVPRKIYPNKQSKLYLHYCEDYNFTVKTSKIVTLIDCILEREKNIDILCYSKTLAKSIIDDKEGIGKKLSDKFGRINNCTSELKVNQRGANQPPKNRFNNKLCNIGTNFKSGVNITKKNHAYVIIMPPKASKMPFRNLSGIFSDGITGIIQAIARQRTKGEIHIILPKPELFDFTSLPRDKMSELQRETFEKYYSKVQSTDGDPKVNYIALNEQPKLLHKFYQEILLQEIKTAKNLIDQQNNKGTRKGLPRLEFPPFEIFVLNRGEEFLTNSFKFFGEDLSSYITYAAFTNQFVNCRLVSLNIKDTMYFEEENLQQNFDNYFEMHWGADYYESIRTYSNFSMFYDIMRKQFFENYNLMIKNLDKWEVIKPFKNSFFEINFLQFCHRIYGEAKDVYKTEFPDKFSFTRSQYLLRNISYSQNNPNENMLTRSYNYLGILRERMISHIKTNKNGRKYLPLKPFPDFINSTDMKKLHASVEVIMQKDPFFKSDLFVFRRNMIKKDSSNQLLSIYKIFLEDFFITPDNQKYIKIQENKDRGNMKPIVSVKELPEVTNSIIMNIDEDPDYKKIIAEMILSPQTPSEKPLYSSMEEYIKVTKELFSEHYRILEK